MPLLLSAAYNAALGQAAQPLGGTTLQQFIAAHPKAYLAFAWSVEVVDREGNHIWTFPTIAPLADLYQAVRYNQAGVSTFIDRLLKEP